MGGKRDSVKAAGSLIIIFFFLKFRPVFDTLPTSLFFSFPVAETRRDKAHRADTVLHDADGCMWRMKHDSPLVVADAPRPAACSQDSAERWREARWSRAWTSRRWWLRLPPTLRAEVSLRLAVIWRTASLRARPRASLLPALTEDGEVTSKPPALHHRGFTLGHH